MLCNFRPALNIMVTGTPSYNEFWKISNNQMVIITLMFNCIAIIQEQKAVFGYTATCYKPALFRHKFICLLFIH